MHKYKNIMILLFFISVFNIFSAMTIETPFFVIVREQSNPKNKRLLCFLSERLAMTVENA